MVTETLDWRLHGFDLLSEHALSGAIREPWCAAADNDFVMTSGAASKWTKV